MPTAARHSAERALQAYEALAAAESYAAAKAAWVYATNINDDTATVNAYLSELYSNRAAELAKQAADFNHVEADPDLRRKLDLMRAGLTMPPPANPMKSERLASTLLTMIRQNCHFNHCKFWVMIWFILVYFGLRQKVVHSLP